MQTLTTAKNLGFPKKDTVTGESSKWIYSEVTLFLFLYK